MARIRALKPDFFRDEELQELQAENPDLYPMFVFAGLWGHCDRQGVFEWRPRTLALDILPFLWCRNGEAPGKQLGDSLVLLWEAKQVARYAHEGKEYGFIPTFTRHQRIGGKESQEAPKYPNPKDMQEVQHRGSTGEAPGKQSRRQEGKGRELKRTKNLSPPPAEDGFDVAGSFETFWKAYPPRNGKKVLKADAERAYRRIVTGPERAAEVMQALTAYKAACGAYPKDACRWLANDRWRDCLRDDLSAGNYLDTWTPTEGAA